MGTIRKPCVTSATKGMVVASAGRMGWLRWVGGCFDRESRMKTGTGMVYRFTKQSMHSEGICVS